MTIATVTLGQAPRLYWKLDDATGPAAGDSSGFGNPGVYGGQFQLGQPGPEAGTNAVVISDGGLIQTLGNTPVTARPYSMTIWVVAERINPAQIAMLYNGNGNARGMGVLWDSNDPTSEAIKTLVGGVTIRPILGSLPIGVAWHHVALTNNAATGATKLYLDGVQLEAPLLAPNVIAATDKFSVGSGLQGALWYAAHAALFNIELTAAQVLAQFNAPAALQAPPPVSAFGITQITSIEADLALILAAVRKTF
jgi:hypothetical protein